MSGEVGPEGLAQWLHHRYIPPTFGPVPWDQLSEEDRLWWRHEAAAVTRAVARGGFREPDQPRQWDALDIALTQCLVEQRLRVDERNRLATETSWPDLSDIYADTRRTVRALCTGELDPDAFLKSLEERT